jgi:Domain of unknown function (DUF4386)
LITFITAIPAQLILYVPVLDDLHYIVGAGADMRVSLGALLEFMLVIANIGTAVVLFPIVKRQSPLVSLRQDFAGTAGADTALLVITGKSLVALHDWTFLFGPGVLAGVGNGMLLGYLMYRSCHAVWPCWGSSAAPYSSLLRSLCCSGSSRQALCGRLSRPSRSSSGSCRLASGSL